MAGAAVEPQILVAGRALPLPAVRTDAAGRAAFSFTLPPDADAGDVRLTAVVRAGGVSETRTARVPVVGRRLAVEFFPEGGNLVAGVPCRVYVRATTLAGEPADVRGTVTDGREVAARVETFTDPEVPGANRGLGAFTFTPKVGGAYRLKLDRPAGVYEPVLGGPVPPVPAAAAGPAAVAAARTGFALPPVKTDGVVMAVAEGVAAPGRPVSVQLWSVGRPRNLVVGAYTRGRLMDTRKVTVAPSRPEVVTLAGDANPRGGVTRVTVFEEPPATGKPADLVPLAERLVYRKPAEGLKLAFDLTAADGAAPAAGGAATLSLRAADEAGRPAAAVLYAAVVDADAAAQADGRRDRLLTTHFLLAGEVQRPDDLEHVDFLLTDGPKAAEALDLLLGTQGWRRFAEQDANPLRRRHTVSSPDLDRLVMLNGQAAGPGETFLDRERRRCARGLLAQVRVRRPAGGGRRDARCRPRRPARAFASVGSPARVAVRTRGGSRGAAVGGAGLGPHARVVAARRRLGRRRARRRAAAFGARRPRAVGPARALRRGRSPGRCRRLAAGREPCAARSGRSRAGRGRARLTAVGYASRSSEALRRQAARAGCRDDLAERG